MAVDRTLLRWACVIAAIVLAFIWLLSETVTGFSAPGWIAPASVVALCLAVVIPSSPVP